MRILAIGLIALGVAAVSIPYAQSQSSARPTMANEADFRRAMKELSNWGRWGNDDELGAANLITAAKRKQALAFSQRRPAGFRSRTISCRNLPPMHPISWSALSVR